MDGKEAGPLSSGERTYIAQKRVRTIRASEEGGREVSTSDCDGNLEMQAQVVASRAFYGLHRARVVLWQKIFSTQRDTRTTRNTKSNSYWLRAAWLEGCRNFQQGSSQLGE